MDTGFTIPKNYSLFFQSPACLTPENAQIICLAEVHEEELIQRQNALFIDEYVQKNRDKKLIVLVEGIKSLTTIDPHAYAQVHYCKEIIEVKGWDLKDAPDLLADSENLKILSRERFEARKELHLAKYPFSIGVLMTKEQEEETEQTCKILRERIRTIEEKMQAEMKKENFFREKQLDLVSAVFQHRNNMLIKTLKEVISIYDKIIVIAGRSHFISLNPDNLAEKLIMEMAQIKDDQYSVKPLINFLQTQEAIILDNKEIGINPCSIC